MSACYSYLCRASDADQGHRCYSYDHRAATTTADPVDDYTVPISLTLSDEDLAQLDAATQQTPLSLEDEFNRTVSEPLASTGEEPQPHEVQPDESNILRIGSLEVSLPSVTLPKVDFELPAQLQQMELPPMPKFVPLNVPFPRRRQTFAVFLWMCLLPFFLGLFFWMLYTNYVTRTIALVYCVYMMQDKAQETGARRSDWVRSWTVWIWFADFFPVSLRVDVPLDPSKNYIFGYHPHGVIGLGAFTTFATESRNIRNLLPGLNIRLLTLDINFVLPFMRDLLLFLNVASASRANITHVLTQPGGNGVMLVVGGAAESMEAFPGTSKVVLKGRLGFIKIALQHGATLVPTFGFGENDIWDQVPNPKGSAVRKFQEAVKRVLTFSPLLFHGRSLITYDYGIMPHRRPITVVTGAPIECPKMEVITEADLLRVQKLYIDGLQDLFDKYKDELLPNRTEGLVII